MHKIRAFVVAMVLAGDTNNINALLDLISSYF